MIDSGAAQAVVEKLEREFIRAEALRYEAWLDFEDTVVEESHQASSPLVALIERSTIPGQIGEVTQHSDGQVQDRLFFLRTVREQTPRVWSAYRDGAFESGRLREIASTVRKLTRPESVEQLDQRVVAYAESHTLAELRRWLRRFVERVEADAATERAEDERRQRHVRIDHADDGMSWLTAYLPSHLAAAIERRLHRESRLQRGDRTLEQTKADLLVAWATSHESDVSAPQADVAIVVDADVLAGFRTGFAESSDGAWSVPAEWLRQLARDTDPFWYRIVRDPVTRDLLSIDSVGRFASGHLRRALEFRDATCTVDRCLVPAWKCDVDHEIPWPHGPTAASNLNHKSKRHHAQKGHGLLG